MDYTFVPMEAIGEDWSLDISRRRVGKEVFTGYSYFGEDDILLAKVTPCFENGKAAIAQGLTEGSGFGTTEVTVVRPGAQVDARYLFYVLNEDGFKQIGVAEMTGAGGLRRVPDRVVRDYRIDLPTLRSQCAIANFLDRETAEIDAFVADQEELIALLTERRAAAISHAVTKGLDSSVPMKDSGIEWIGTVPEHWDVGQAKHYGTLTLGKMLQDSPTDDAVRLAQYMRAANVQPEGRLALHDVKEMWFSPRELARLELMRGDVVIVEGGVGGFGRAAHVDEDLSGWGFQNSIIRIRPGAQVNSGRFVTYQFLHLRAVGYIEMAASVTSMPHFTVDKVSKTLVSWPSFEEQELIADHLDRETAEIDATITDAREAIALSKERRAALISAAVKGKIDVRNHRGVE